MSEIKVNFDRWCPRGIVVPAVILSSAMEKYTGTTPSGRKVAGRLEVEEGISHIVTTDKDGYETWNMVHTSSVRKEGEDG